MVAAAAAEMCWESSDGMGISQGGGESGLPLLGYVMDLLSNITPKSFLFTKVKEFNSPKFQMSKSLRIREYMIPRIRESKIPRVQKSKSPRFQEFKTGPRVRESKSPRVHESESPRL